MKRYVITVLVSLVSVTMLMAGDLAINKTFGGNSNYEIKKGNDNIIIVSPGSQFNNRGTSDTLQYHPADGGWNAQFIQSPGDAMITAFKMPADATIKAINVPIYEWGTGEQQMTISLHKLSYPSRADGSAYPGDVVDGAGWIGGYDMDADGHMAIEGTTYSPGGTAGICDAGDVVNDGAQDPLGTELASASPPGTPKMGLLWPLGFTSATMAPATHPDFVEGGNLANWTNLIDFAEEVDVQRGDWIGVMVASTGAGGGDDEATGFLYESGDGVVDPWVSMKFYAGCEGTSGNGGWHIRHWMFNFQLAVELTGDRGPKFESVKPLPTTLSTGSRTVSTHVTDDNPSGEAAGVETVTLTYMVDSLNATPNTVEMSLVSGDAEDGVWEGDIGGQDPGTFVYWALTATDNNGIATSISTQQYFIFSPTEGKDLIYNNQPPLYGSLLYTELLYFYIGGGVFDLWDGSYGAITDELTAHYTTIAELAGQGPFYNSDDEIANWWGGDKTYIVAGDEWLGVRYGWPGPDAPMDIPAGDVAKDILGVDVYYSDINYAAAGDQGGVSRLMAGSDGYASNLAAFLSDSLSLNYNPGYETGGDNWLDGVDPVDGYSVDMTGYSLVLDSTDAVPPADAVEYNVMISGQQGNGGASAFLAFDPMSLNTVPSYYWIGAAGYAGFDDNVNPMVQAYEGLTTLGVKGDISGTPDAFSLKGNYPNPFNPSTNISFNLDVRSDVTVTVYSLLGEEVTTITNSAMHAGLQSVKWNGLDREGLQVASGVYIYRVEAQNRALTGKMMLLK